MELDLPRLSAGRHPFTRRRGCFMEAVSLLAGERWSDHPSCTHPVVAALARTVNDRLSDAARPRLVPLVPLAIGTTSPDPLVAVRLAFSAMRRVVDLVGSSPALECSMLLAEQHLGTPPDVLAARYSPRTFEAAQLSPGLAGYAEFGCPASASLAARVLSERPLLGGTDAALVGLLEAVLLAAAPQPSPPPLLVSSLPVREPLVSAGRVAG